MAAGAMLTMITSAMIPEAVHMGNANGVGLSTLAGFLAAIAFKLLE
jgi:2-phosphoglycerate kinase